MTWQIAIWSVVLWLPFAVLFCWSMNRLGRERP